MAVLLFFLALAPLNLAGNSGNADAPLAPTLSVGDQLVEISPELLLDEDLLDELVLETVIIDPVTTGIDHIKVNSGSSLLYDFQAAAAASQKSLASKKRDFENQIRELQESLAAREPGACIDESTPADGHCLFHACTSGGLFTEEALGFGPAVFKLRRMALSLATDDQADFILSLTDKICLAMAHGTIINMNVISL